MEFYQYDRKWLEELGLDGSDHCICGILKMSSYGAAGWAEYKITGDASKFQLIRWATLFMRLKGRSIAEGLQLIDDQKVEWGLDRIQLAEDALLALCRNLLAPVPPQSDNIVSLERNILIDRSISYFSF